MSINNNNNILNEILSTINELPEADSGKEEVEKTVDIIKNGETVVTPDDENTTLSKVTVNVTVPEQKEEQEKSIDITENGTTEVTPDEGKALSKVTVNVDVASSGGVGAVKEKDITFIDYDGTLIASYTVEEAHALTELPQPPKHEGLTFQSWNWTLDEIKQWDNFAYIGAHYATTDGKTRIYFTLSDPEYLSPTLNFWQTNANGVTIDWGDGSDTELSGDTVLTQVGVVSTNDVVKITHNYSSVGDYVITLECTQGTFFFYGLNNTSGGYMSDILTLNETIYYGNRVYYNTVTKIEVGSSCTGLTCRSINLRSCNIPESITQIDHFNYHTLCVPKVCNRLVIQNPTMTINVGNIIFPYSSAVTTLEAFGYNIKRCCFGNIALTSIPALQNTKIERLCIPNTVTAISCHSNNYYLKEVICHENITSLATNAFKSSISLQNINLPEGITSLPQSCFESSGIQKLTIPNSVTSIGNRCFYSGNLYEITVPENVATVGASAFVTCSEMVKVTVLSPKVTFGDSAFSFGQAKQGIKRYYDFTKAIVIDGVLSYTFGTNVFNNIKADTVIMFATKEIADVAKETTNLAAYADYIHYLGEEEATE